MENAYSSWHYPILYRLGFYSSHSSKRVSVLSPFYITLSIFILCMALIQFPNMGSDVFELVNNFEAIFGYGQILGKIVITFKKQEDLTKLLRKTKQFWNTDICPKHVKIELDQISSNARVAEKIFVCCMVFSVIGVIIYALIEDRLLLGVWNLKGYKFLYKWTLLSQIIVISIGGFAVSVFDCIFFTICIQTIIQFKILCYCLTDIPLPNVISENDHEQFYSKMKLYIKQHNMLLEFLEDLQSYYSPVLFVQCIVIVPLICTEMYALLDVTSMDQLLRHSPSCLAQIFQLSFYCIVADSLSREALEVGDAIYGSKWYFTNFSTLGKPVTLLIQKSQQPIIFTAGGFFEIKSSTILTVLKMAWSTCTVMRGLKEKK